MSPVSRETVNQAVNEYGLAWTTQDHKRIGRLFTEDAVYVERSFDKRATFRGRSAIEKYWQYQICGKQSNISFRHVDSEMVRDADNPIAVVKWLAEFDNRREKRADKARKRVRFCQMAKLIFERCPLTDDSNAEDEFETKISYLEEYAQGMVGKSFQWPGINSTAHELWEKIRFEPPKPPAPVQCQKCGEYFQSRTKLFEHIRNTDAHYDSNGRCVCLPNELAREKLRMECILICLSVSYTCMNPHEKLICAWNTIQNATQAHMTSKSSHLPKVTLTWAVPLHLSPSALVNIVTMKLPRLLMKDIQVESLPKLLNDALERNDSGEGSKECRIFSSDDGHLDMNEHGLMRVHTAGIVDRPCAPERREFETYAAFVPWRFLSSSGQKSQSQPIDDTGPSEDTESGQTISTEDLQPNNSAQTSKEGELTLRCKQSNIWRKPIEETSAFQFVDSVVARRLKHGARLMKDGGYGSSLEKNSYNNAETEMNLGQKIRVRTSTMEEPMHGYCKISISMKQTVPGNIQRLVGLLFAYARDELSECNFIAALKDRSAGVAIHAPGLRQYSVDHFPPNFIVLIEPAIARYENKVKIRLCRRGKTNTQMSESMEASLDEAERMMMLQIRRGERILDHWLYGDLNVEDQQKIE